MAIAPIAAATTGTPSVANNASKQLSSNFDTFLTLLTSQLQNQDPLSPMDSNQFTQQLVQFSSVEQQINSNKNLEQLISLTKSRSAADAVSYLGKKVTTTDGSAALINGEAEWTYTLKNDAAATGLVVSDANGKAVYTAYGSNDAGKHAFSWNGKNFNGDQMPDGAYKLTIKSLAGDGSAVSTSIASHNLVSEIDMTGDEPLLMLGRMGVKLGNAAYIGQ